jgi:hypothetical protein
MLLYDFFFGAFFVTFFSYPRGSFVILYIVIGVVFPFICNEMLEVNKFIIFGPYSLTINH